MNLPWDDQLYDIPNRWLGAKGWTFPFQARYSAWGVWLAVFLVSVVGLHRVGILDVLTAVWAAMFAVFVSWALHKRITSETPLRTLLVGFWRETTAPRPPAPVTLYVDVPKRRAR